MNSINQQKAALEAEWRKELRNGVSKKSEKLRQKLSCFCKVNYPVIISHVKGVDFFSNAKYSYGEINFSKATTGWFDSSIFQKINDNKRFVPNYIGEKIQIRLSRSGGSAFLEFKFTNRNVEIIKAELERAGYKVSIN